MFILPTIDENKRLELKKIFESQYQTFTVFSEYIKWHKTDKFLDSQDHINKFRFESINLIRNYENKEIMHWFSFNIKNVLKICKILNLDTDKFKDPSRYAAGRILPYCTVPMHVDPNFTGNREYCIFSIALNGKDSQVYFSNSRDGSKKVCIPGIFDWAFYPTLIEHGTITQSESLDLIQIILT